MKPHIAVSDDVDLVLGVTAIRDMWCQDCEQRCIGERPCSCCYRAAERAEEAPVGCLRCGTSEPPDAAHAAHEHLAEVLSRPLHRALDAHFDACGDCQTDPYYIWCPEAKRLFRLLPAAHRTGAG